MTKKETKILAWTVILVFETAFFAWYFGLVPPPAPAGSLTMSRADHALCVSAMDLVRSDMTDYKTTEEAKDAFI